MPPAGLVATARHPARYGPRRSLAAVASRRPAHRPPRRRLLADRMRTPPFHIPSAAAAPLRVDRLPHPTRHELSAPPLLCSHTGTGTGLPHGVERRYHPARVWQALSAEPVGELQASALIRSGTVTGGSSRSGITAEGAPSAILTAQACSSAAVAPAAVFQIPSVAAAANCRAPATTPGAGVAAGPPGRGLCAALQGCFPSFILLLSSLSSPPQPARPPS